MDTYIDIKQNGRLFNEMLERQIKVIFKYVRDLRW